MSCCVTCGPVMPTMRTEPNEVVSLKDMRRQAALNVALLSSVGCSVKIRPYTYFNGCTVESIALGREELFNVYDVRQGAYESDVKKDDLKGYHDMLFNGCTSYILRRKGYEILDSFCENEIYPYYRKTESVVLPSGGVVIPRDNLLDAIAFYIDSNSEIPPFDRVLIKILYEMNNTN